MSLVQSKQCRGEAGSGGGVVLALVIMVFHSLKSYTVPVPLYAAACMSFYPFFTSAAAYTADNLCTKQGNVGLKSAAYK